jgi:hypothetical protein
MTRMLEQALAEVGKLTEPEQDAIANVILDELADEERWERAFATTQPVLAKLAAKARAEVRAVRAKNIRMDPARRTTFH